MNAIADATTRTSVRRSIGCRPRSILALASVGLLTTLLAPAKTVAQSGSATTTATKLRLPAGVEKLCSIPFDKDERRPARVEDGALTCLDSIAKTLKEHPDRKLVLVGVQDPVKDHEERDKGEERETEDMTGLDVRWDDISMYRAVNTKLYLTNWYGIDPSRLIPTTNEGRDGQDVAFYLVPGDADFLHNYLNTTRTNESTCTVKPCYDPREEALTPQPRDVIRSTLQAKQ
jgi:hypothetical protein